MSVEFHAGDRVRLSVGGPVMTVKEIRSSRVTCSWYETHQGWQQKIYEIQLLRRVGRSRSQGQRRAQRV